MNKSKEDEENTFSSSSEEFFSLENTPVGNEDCSVNIKYLSSQELNDYCHFDSALFRPLKITNGRKKYFVPKTSHSMPELACSDILIATKSYSAFELRHAYVTCSPKNVKNQASSAVTKMNSSDSNDFWGFPKNIFYENYEDYVNSDETFLDPMTENERTGMGNTIEVCSNIESDLFDIRKLTQYSLCEKNIVSPASKICLITK